MVSQGDNVCAFSGGVHCLASLDSSGCHSPLERKCSVEVSLALLSAVIPHQKLANFCKGIEVALASRVGNVISSIAKPGVPHLRPISCISRLQEPKSMKTGLAPPASTMILLGFRLLWMSPRRCKWLMPSSIPRRHAALSNGAPLLTFSLRVMSYRAKQRLAILLSSTTHPRYSATLGCGCWTRSLHISNSPRMSSPNLQFGMSPTSKRLACFV